MRKCIFILLVILAVSYRLEAKKQEVVMPSAIAFLLIGICNIIEIAYLCSSVICLLICNFFFFGRTIKAKIANFIHSE